jgi:hypothetical protein
LDSTTQSKTYVLLKPGTKGNDSTKFVITELQSFRLWRQGKIESVAIEASTVYYDDAKIVRDSLNGKL